MSLDDNLPAGGSQGPAAGRLDLMTRAFRVLADLGDLQDTVERIVRLVREQTGCDAVGIRLRKGEDFPYFHYLGLNEDFSCTATGLCEGGDPVGENPAELACRCGAVLEGRVGGDSACFTAAGSFWSTTLRTAYTPPPTTGLRGSCAQAGFESVALIPLRTGPETVGLLQLYDRRPEYFARSDITFLEEMGAALGLAYARERSRQDLEARSRELAAANRELAERMRTLTTFAGFLRRDLGAALPERAERDLGFMVEAAERMGELIRALLTLSRTGREAIPEEAVDLDRCLDDALAALDTTIKESGARVDRAPLPPTRGHRALLTGLLQNLVGNALKFAGHGPPRIRIAAEQGPAGIVYGVADHGIGVDPRHREEIFAPFKRSPVEGGPAGSGIGLAICRKTVERHGGRIWVEEGPEGGAHFRFTLARGG